MRLKHISILTVLIILFSCSSSVKYSNKKQFDCNDYWLQDNIEWQKVDTNHFFGQGNIIIKSDSSNWYLLYPGSISKISDTLNVNLEAGHENTCEKIDNKYFKMDKDTIEYEQNKYVRLNSVLQYACSCKLIK